MALGNTPISSALLAGRRRSGNLFVKQQPSDAFPTIASAWVWGTAVSSTYTLTAQGGSYSLTGSVANISRSYLKPYLISSTAITLGTSATPGAQSITIPPTAQLVVVHFSAYNGTAQSLSSLTSTGTGTFTIVQDTGSEITGVAYAVVSSTGAKTITPTWSATCGEGPIFFVSYVEGVNTSDYFRAAGSQGLETSGANSTTTISTATNDLVIVHNKSDTSLAATITGHTSINSQSNNAEFGRLQTTNSPGASSTTITGTTTNWDGISAISIKVVTAGGSYTLIAQGGSYSLGGGSVVLKRDKLLIGSGGNYTLTGQNANLVKGRVLTAQAGAYSLTGASSNIYRSKRIVSTGGAYNLTGANANLLKSKVLVAQGGTYTYTGQSVTITYTAGTVNYTLTALGGSYALTGASALVSRNRVLTSSGGSYTYTGSSANLLRSKYLLSSGGSYSVTGASANILKSKVLVASAGAYTYTGGTATLLRSKYLKGSGGVYSLVGSSAILTWTGVGGAVWPPTHQVLLGTMYGPTGTEYIGTLDVTGIKYDIVTGQLVKPINDKVVMSI